MYHIYRLIMYVCATLYDGYLQVRILSINNAVATLTFSESTMGSGARLPFSMPPKGISTKKSLLIFKFVLTPWLSFPTTRTTGSSLHNPFKSCMLIVFPTVYFSDVALAKWLVINVQPPISCDLVKNSNGLST
ncbi:hypothetical protein WN66_06040 [Saccharomyces cerevisiae]|nr:hypothetical protein WN66_06040 [Saccharomyces cerevisiae]